MMPVIHEYITKDGLVTDSLTPVKAIRQKCLECSNWQPKEVRLCPIGDCAIFPYRFGTDPSRKGIDVAKNLPLSRGEN